ncbi:MAG TPA: hypothetical protein VGA89_00080 [Patescibacteria group bacterium]|jgi:hypothetical protein
MLMPSVVTAMFAGQVTVAPLRSFLNALLLLMGNIAKLKVLLLATLIVPVALIVPAPLLEEAQLAPAEAPLVLKQLSMGGVFVSVTEMPQMMRLAVLMDKHVAVFTLGVVNVLELIPYAIQNP